MTSTPPLRIAVLQRACPVYRAPLFRRLSERQDITFRLFIGADLPDSKVRSAADLGGIALERCETSFVSLAGRRMPYHRGLVDRLRAFRPDVIVCEGESHFLGYLTAAYYRLVHDRRCALLHWCFIALPGEGRRRLSPATWVKALTRRLFDGHVVYSHFSKSRLLERGVPEARIHVATNVGDVETIAARARLAAPGRAALRRRLFGDARFVVLFVGTLDPNKRPELLVEIASRPEHADTTFVLCGDGRMRGAIEEMIRARGLTNVRLAGNVGTELVDHYVAAHVLLVPGLGGIVISEAMAAGLPAVAYRCDGTERDLIIPGATGTLVPEGSVDAFSEALGSLAQDPDAARRMGAEAQRRLTTDCSSGAMVDTIVGAAADAFRRRNPTAVDPSALPAHLPPTSPRP